MGDRIIFCDGATTEEANAAVIVGGRPHSGGFSHVDKHPSVRPAVLIAQQPHSPTTV
ncbi:MAG TPA: hypothetical protein VN888_23870 [Mycobacterium sp.]|nr:hypothetical protein [Mycobacterium sp.]